MYRLLIVDDEEIIVNGLYEIFQNLNNADLDVYKAYSGREAMDWLSRTRIDIVLSDINMPGINGLELLIHIQKNWPQCHVVFLSGHEEFSYVYEAIKHTNVTYILKSEDPDKVVSAVLSAISRIENDVRTEDLVHQAKVQIEQAKALFQSDYILSLLRDESLQAEAHQLTHLGIPLRHDQPVIVMIGRLSGIRHEMSYSKRIESLNALRLLVSKYLGLHLASSAVLDDRHQYVWLLQPSSVPEDGQYDAVYTFLSGTLEFIQTVCEDKIGFSSDFILSENPVAWDGLTDEYLRLSSLLESRTSLPGELIFGTNKEGQPGFEENTASLLRDAQQDGRELESLLMRRRAGQTRMMLETGDKERFFESVNPILDILAMVKSKHNNYAAEAYFDISMAYLNYINRRQLADTIAFRASLAKLSNADLFDTWQEAVHYLRELGTMLFDLRGEDDNTRMSRMLALINEFVLDNLGKDLSLVRLAELVHLNPSYLSRLYKHLTGINLSAFIETAKVQKAKTLLLSLDQRVADVALQVGYDSSASFTRFFRKATGVTPQEFRDQSKNGNKSQ